ncbi:glutaredoxin family protein [Endozoicomonas ascidiicola]|uniref:glutaredoxin family protein n=1 Tax=Endozoicomonas ascidiicola TaxID=1698521 RepID=UPI0008374A7E|nr:glutaredoxin family protein [Endozoicomonas ascidiicola]
MTQLLLYTTAGCHLCEDAQKILEIIDCKWSPIEISTDNDLIEHYGIRIPVVGIKGQEEELGWPFSENELKNWLNKITSG